MLNKALIHKDFKKSKWVAMAVLFYFFIGGILAFFLDLSDIKAEPVFEPQHIVTSFLCDVISNDSLYLFSILSVFILAVFLFYELRSSKYSLIASMPFTRKEIIVSKLFVGISIIVLIHAIEFLMICFMYFTNIEILGDYISVINLIQWLINNILVNCVIFTFVFMIFSLTGNVISGTVVSAIMFVFPQGFAGLISILLRQFFKFKTVMPIIDKTWYIANSITIFYYNEVYWWYEGDYFGFQYNNIGMNIIIMLISSIIFSIIAVYLYDKNSLEKNGSFIMFKSFKRLFVAGVTICSSMTLCAVLGSSNTINDMWRIVLLLAGGTIGYFISTRLLGLTLKKA